MKKTFALFIALAFVFCPLITGASGASDADEVPEFVMNYIEKTAMPMFKEFMGKPGNSYVPQYFSSKEEVDGLHLGSVYTLYSISAVEGKLSDVLEPAGGWLFTLDLDEPKVFADVFKGEPLDTYGPVTAENLVDALTVLKRAADNAGIEFKPVLIDYGWHYLIAYMSFNGDDRVIPIPTTAFKLDEEYSSVTDYAELPTGEELLAKIEQMMSKKNTNDKGEPLYGDDVMIRLNPHLGAGKGVMAAVKTNEGNSPLRVILPIAVSAAIIAAAAAAVVLIKRKKA